MKRISSFVFAIVLSALLLSLPTNAAYSNASINASKGTPVVDGEMEELWYTTEMQTIETIDTLYYTNSSETTGTLRVMWDENYLYFFITVDKHGIQVYNNNEGDLVANDVVSISTTLDGNFFAAIYGGTEYAGDLRSYGDESGIYGGGWLLQDNRSASIKWKFNITGTDTFQNEVAIPWHDLSVDEGDIASLEVCINSMQTASRRAGIIWAANEYLGWQGSDCHGKIVLSAASKEPISKPGDTSDTSNSDPTSEDSTVKDTEPSDSTDETLPPETQVTSSEESSTTPNTTETSTDDTSTNQALTTTDDTTDTTPAPTDKSTSAIWYITGAIVVGVIAVVVVTLLKKKR